MANNKSPGRDRMTGYWIKNISATHEQTFKIYRDVLNNSRELPDWLTRTTTRMIPKNNNTDDAMNFRPIACQNNMFKQYSAILANFLSDHCERNQIITQNQAAGKKDSWGCLDQHREGKLHAVH